MRMLAKPRPARRIFQLAIGFSFLAAIAPSPAAASDTSCALAVSSSDAGSQSLAVAQMSLAYGLLSEVGDGEDTVVVSPVSAASSLALLYHGASTAMQKAIHATIGFDRSASRDQRRRDLGTLYAWGRSLSGGDARERENLPLTFAEAVWFDVNTPPYGSTLVALGRHVTNDPMMLDFAAPDTLAAVNAWVAAATGGLIPTILEDLPQDAAMVAVNALHFKADWLVPFDPHLTVEAPFYRADGNAVDVLTMRRFGSGCYRVDDRFVAVDLPYDGDRYRMTVLTTRDRPTGDAPKPLTTFDAAWPWLSGGGFREGALEIALPAFRASGAHELLDTLRTLGLGDLLDQDASFARFSAVPPRLSRVRQRVEIVVDEAGTEAAAATAALTTRGADFDVVKAAFDRPFVFALRDAQNGVIVLAGYVGDPSKGRNPMAADEEVSPW